MSSQYGELRPISGWDRFTSFGHPVNFNGFAQWLRYYVTHRKLTKLCTMFGRLMGSYTIYTFSGALSPWRNFARCKVHFTSKSCVLLYIGSVRTTLQQRESAKLCGVLQGIELQNFRRGRHLHLVGRPSCLASAHILVCSNHCTRIDIVRWRCWLGGRKCIRPVKTEWWGTGVVICLERGANDLHMVQLMSLPSHHLLPQ